MKIETAGHFRILFLENQVSIMISNSKISNMEYSIFSVVGSDFPKKRGYQMLNTPY